MWRTEDGFLSSLVCISSRRTSNARFVGYSTINYLLFKLEDRRTSFFQVGGRLKFNPLALKTTNLKGTDYIDIMAWCRIATSGKGPGGLGARGPWAWVYLFKLLVYKSYCNPNCSHRYLDGAPPPPRTPFLMALSSPIPTWQIHSSLLKFKII